MPASVSRSAPKTNNAPKSTPPNQNRGGPQRNKQAPKANTPTTNAPKANAPTNATPRTNAPNDAAPKANTPTTNTPRANTPNGPAPQGNAPPAGDTQPTPLATRLNQPAGEGGAPRANLRTDAAPQADAPPGNTPATNAPPANGPNEAPPQAGAPAVGTNKPSALATQLNRAPGQATTPQGNAPNAAAPETNTPAGAPAAKFMLSEAPLAKQTAANPPTAQTPEDTAKLQEMDTFLAPSKTGKEATDYIKNNNIPVEFASGGGSYYQNGKIVIDRTQNSEEAALTLVHEVNHAKAAKEGTTGNPSTQTRDDYINTMVEEESVGTVKSIEAKRELQAAGTQTTATFPLENEYNTAYNDAVTNARNTNPNATDAELDAAGKKAGLDRVRNGFNNGEVVPSVDGTTNYRDYYGKGYDAVNPPAPTPAV
jgi:hypothetical protein